MMSRCFIIFALLGCLCSPLALGKPLLIAVASNFYHPLSQVLKEDIQRGHVRLVAAASGVLYQQILRGAPFDVFFSADLAYPSQLYERDLSSAPVHYTSGILVWWQPEEKETVKTERPFVIPHPELAPYGRVASQQTQYANQQHWVTSDNVLHAFQLMNLGHSAGGFTAKSILIHAAQRSGDPKYLVYQAIADPTKELAQYAVILKRNPADETARRIVQQITDDAAQCKLVALGYQPLDPKGVC